MINILDPFNNKKKLKMYIKICLVSIIFLLIISILIGGITFYKIESSTNQNLKSLQDSFIYSFGKLIGYSINNIKASTSGGKIVAIFLEIFKYLFCALLFCIFFNAILLIKIWVPKYFRK